MEENIKPTTYSTMETVELESLFNLCGKMLEIEAQRLRMNHSDISRTYTDLNHAYGEMQTEIIKRINNITK